MAITSGQPTGSARSSLGGKIFSTLFFGLFATIGTLFFVLLGAMAWQTIAASLWDEVTCTILESSMQTEGDGGWQVRYRYAYGGREYESTTLTLGGFSRDYSADLRESQRYVAGEPARCYVNPDAPEEAVLLRESAWTALWGLFPLPFMAVGYGGMYYTWRRRPAKSRAATAGYTPAARARANAVGSLVAFVVFALFLLIGSVLTWFLGLKPLLRVSEAKSWLEVPCTILSSAVQDHDSEDGTTYSVHIVYRYKVDGRTYTADRYSFMTGSSSGRAGKIAVVGQYPPGSTAVCFVNPADPTDAVIDRGYSAVMAFGFIPLAFALVGAGGLIGAMLRRARSPASAAFQAPVARIQRSTSSTLTPTVLAGDGGQDGPVVLEARGSRGGKFVAFLVFGLIWNGIISIFVVNLVQDWSRGADWFMLIFLLPFIAVGVFVLGAAAHAGLAMFNPRPRLQVSSAAVPPGGTIEVAWEIIGHAGRLQDFRVLLEGREEATYRRGTDTRTDKSIFARIVIAEAHDPAGIAAGRTKYTLPPDTMHSFATRNNKIVWMLRVSGSIPRWPDVDDEFPFTVLAANAVNPFATA